MAILPLFFARDPAGEPVTFDVRLAALDPILWQPGMAMLASTAWRRYRDEGDLEALEAAGFAVDSMPVVTMRPIAAGAESDRIELEAGPPETWGAMILAQTWDVSRSAEQNACAIDSLPEAERAAIHRHEVRSRRLTEARLKAAIVAIDGEETWTAPGGRRLLAPWYAVDSLIPQARALAIAELSAHLDRLSRLGPEGKAPSGQP